MKVNCDDVVQLCPLRAPREHRHQRDGGCWALGNGDGVGRGEGVVREDHKAMTANLAWWDGQERSREEGIEFRVWRFCSLTWCILGTSRNQT